MPKPKRSNRAAMRQKNLIRIARPWAGWATVSSAEGRSVDVLTMSGSLFSAYPLLVSRVILFLLLRGTWRKMFEHLFRALLDVLVRVVRQCAARAASPEQLLCLRVEKIDDQRPYRVGVRCGRGFPKTISKTTTSKSSPTPASTEAVVESIQSLLIVRHLDCYDRNIAT